MSEMKSDSDMVLHAPKVEHWRHRVVQANCTVHSLQVLYPVLHHQCKLLFGLFKAEVKDPNGNLLMPTVFIRGDACVIVPYIRKKGSHEGKFLMIRQRRIGNGHLSLEFPAGMLDENIHDPVLTAIQEMQEEAGVIIHAENLKALCKHPLYSSPGCSDEAIYYFGCILDLDAQEFDSLDGRNTGLIEEGERIEVCLMEKAEAIEVVSSLQVRLAFALFEEVFGKMESSTLELNNGK